MAGTNGTATRSVLRGSGRALGMMSTTSGVIGFGYFEIVPVMLADFDPGTLTGFYILLIGGIGAVFCLALAIVTAMFKRKRVARGFLIAGGVVFAAAILIGCLAIGFGKALHLL